MGKRDAALSEWHELRVVWIRGIRRHFKELSLDPGEQGGLLFVCLLIVLFKPHVFYFILFFGLNFIFKICEYRKF